MDAITAAVERLDDLIVRRPGFGVATDRASTTLGDRVTCSSEEGHWTTVTDLGPALGGTATGPTPSALLRAALGACMAMSYRLRAARHGVELAAVRVTVETDSALAGMLACDADAPPGFTGVRYHVDVQTSAPAADVERVIAEGDRLSPLLDVLTRPVPVERTLSIRPVEV